MKNLINFLLKTGKLKKIRRSGWVLRKVKDPETIAGHSFRLAILGWILGKKKEINPEKIIKLALIHDLCEVYSGDITPYDDILPKDEKKQKELLNKWPRFSDKKKKEYIFKKHKKEWESLKKIVSDLSIPDQKEIINLWCEYELGLSEESRFMKQLDKVENLIQALEYWQEDKDFPIVPWWIQIKEEIDDPILLDFVYELDKKFHPPNFARQSKKAPDRKHGMQKRGKLK